ncbi:SDR family NAD(P)-dependent oxidoreductase [Amycolatopsis thermophila]|uniref:NAD(P)-dependent dehydrogenase (Short-subunit alcohol dehydrogenase family) n=1 Tax=Amycolatopsis thermophila TaxID=206084 RepID=A0ABU0F1Q9_9PSEU|nr:SDR family NAD(P)-dependent oxidoreductase [Amycolatopsis thermophila]MDQ0381279.1 NAD(P)-dependent dehydrogenase (short-subunit alcohol dehydrogenase family) [Amycolatopsis thermophila]
MTDARTTKNGLDGKVAFVTGGAQGIGAAISAALAEAGATVVIGDLDEERAGRTAGEVAAAAGGKAGAVAVDVTDPVSVAAAARATLDRHGRVDVLVNNAGISNDQPTFEHDDATWDRTIAVNLSGAFFAAREFGRHMRERGGAIVNISSIAALVAGSPERHVAYDVSKAGIIALTRTLGVEWAPLGIRVNAVAPGYTDTEILRAVGSANPEVLDTWLSQVPQRRLIDPAEIARVVTYLASDGASAITGQLIVADGGYSASA